MSVIAPSLRAPPRPRRAPASETDERTIRRAALGGTLLLHLGLLASSFELRPPEPLRPLEPPVSPLEIEAIRVIDVPDEAEVVEAPEPEDPAEPEEPRLALADPGTFVAPDPVYAPPPPGPALADVVGGAPGPTALPDLPPIEGADLPRIAILGGGRGGVESALIARLDVANSKVISVLGTADNGTIDSLILAAPRGEGALDAALGQGGGGFGDGIGGVVGGTVGSGSGEIGGLGLSGTGRLREPHPVDSVRTAEDPEALRRYVERIRQALRRAQRYPAAAQDDGLTGTVSLELTLDGQGTVLGVKLLRGSGHTILDDAALEAARGLAHLPAPPPGLTWERRAFRINLRYVPDPL